MAQSIATDTKGQTSQVKQTGASPRSSGSVFGTNPPVLNPIPPQKAHPDRILTFTATATDPDGDPNLVFTLIGAPPAGAFMDPTGTFTWTPTWAQLATYTLTARVTDSDGMSDQKNFTVTVDDAAPTLDPLPAVGPGHPGRLLAFTATASDPDLDPLVFSLVGAPLGATIDGLGNFTWTPTWAQVATYTFSVKVSDPGGLSAQRSISINVANQAPVIDPIPTQPPAHPGRVVAFSVVASDLDGDPITYALVNSPAGANIDDLGNVTWTPTWAQIGTFSITVRVTDPGGLSASRSVSITVANQAPVLDPLPAVAAGHPDRAMTFTATGSDPDGDPVTFSLSSGPVGATMDVDGNFLWTPTWAQLGTSPITVRVTDPGGLYASRTANLTVADQAPTMGPLADQAVTVNTPVAFSVLAMDPDFDPLTFTLLSPPPGAAIDAAGNFSWTPTMAGTYIITVRATDPGGLYAQRNCTITVNP